jgi:hypothetical protein
MASWRFSFLFLNVHSSIPNFNTFEIWEKEASGAMIRALAQNPFWLKNCLSEIFVIAPPAVGV